MRIMVTGCDGFVGRNVCNYIKQATGIQPIGLHHANNLSSRPPECGVDLMDMFSTDLAIAKFDPDVIVHLAGLVGGIGANQNASASFMYQNLQMGMNILEAASLSSNISRVVMVGTVCSYPCKPTTIPFVEEELWDGYPEPTNAGYGIAKRTLVELAQQYNKYYSMTNISLLPVNMYGPHDNFSLDTGHVIPSLMRKMHMAKIHEESTIQLWGTGSATREFMYVEDFAAACLNACLVNRDIDTPINIGTGEEISIAKLALLIREIVGYEGTFVYNNDRPDGQPRRSLNIDKAKELLRWEPITDLRKGLEQTYKWYVENISENHYI